MICETCKRETNKLIAGLPSKCPECYSLSKCNSIGLKTVVYLDPKNGTGHLMKTSNAEINHLKEWKPREYRSQTGLGY